MYPLPIRDVLRDSVMKYIFLDFLLLLLAPLITGIANYIRFQRLERLPVRWGWKDPKNTFTLPLWMELFPEAKVLHVKRHGVDVAYSLHTRYRSFVNGVQRNRRRIKRLFYLRWMIKFFPRPKPMADFRTRTLEGAHNVWMEYISRANEYLKSMDPVQYLVKYEDLLKDSVEQLFRVIRFLDVHPLEDEIRHMVRSIDQSRAFAYR